MSSWLRLMSTSISKCEDIFMSGGLFVLTTLQVKMLTECSLVEIWHIEVVLNIVFTTFMGTIFTHHSGGSRIFPRGGREHAKLSRKLHEIERIWTPRGGACVPHAPPRSANASKEIIPTRVVFRHHYQRCCLSLIG